MIVHLYQTPPNMSSIRALCDRLGMTFLKFLLSNLGATGGLRVNSSPAYNLSFVQSDSISRLFATVFSIMTFGGSLFALKQKRVLELVSVFVYAGSAIGVVFAGDLISLFIFWEIMAVASTVVVLSAGGKRSYQISMRYFFVCKTTHLRIFDHVKTFVILR